MADATLVKVSLLGSSSSYCRYGCKAAGVCMCAIDVSESVEPRVEDLARSIGDFIDDGDWVPDSGKGGSWSFGTFPWV